MEAFEELSRDIDKFHINFWRLRLLPRERLSNQFIYIGNSNPLTILSMAWRSDATFDASLYVYCTYLMTSAFGTPGCISMGVQSPFSNISFCSFSINAAFYKMIMVLVDESESHWQHLYITVQLLWNVHSVLRTVDDVLDLCQVIISIVRQVPGAHVLSDGFSSIEEDVHFDDVHCKGQSLEFKDVIYRSFAVRNGMVTME